MFLYHLLLLVHSLASIFSPFCHRLMCLTSHWARKCINCYSKQRAILGALVQKMKYFSFSFFLSETSCAAGEGAVCSGSESMVFGGLCRSCAWPLLGKQQRFDEGLISEMAWCFSLLWRLNKATLPKSATRHPVLFHMMRIHVDFFPVALWLWQSGLWKAFAFFFFLELNRESWCLQRRRDVFTTHKCCSSWSCIDFRQNC